MTPKEKARELVQKYYKINAETDSCFGNCENEGMAVCDKTGHGCDIWLTHAKQCALITVGECLEFIEHTVYDHTLKLYLLGVKAEINKL